MILGKFSKEEFHEIFSQVPRLCVEVVIQNENGILLTKREIEPSKGMWHFPGGGIIFGEILEETVKRIAKEELNLDVEIIKFLGTIEFPEKEETFGHPISLAYLVKVNSGEIKLNWQASEFDFFKEIPENTLSAHKRFIQEKLNLE